MTNKELRWLGRKDLIELMLNQARELDQLREQLAQTQQQLAQVQRELTERKIRIEKAGSLAEASLQLSGVFQAAQDACALYTYNMEELSHQKETQCAQLEQQTRDNCEKMVAAAQKQANACWESVCHRIEQLCGDKLKTE